MKVSAIIPTLNMVHLLPKAIESLRNQTYPIHEIIVADDNSTDSTWSYLLQNPDIKTVRNYNEHWGICGGRNQALSIATGDAILPLDADDWVEPTYLEKTIPLLKDGVGIVSTYMEYFGSREGTVIRTRKTEYETELLANQITVCSLVLKEAVDKAGPYDVKLKGWEDWDMWLRILKLGYKHEVVPEILFHYHLWEGGMNNWANQNREFLTNYLATKHRGFRGRN